MVERVVGITGTIGAGKKVVKKFLLSHYNCYHVTLSDVIRGEIEKKHGRFDRSMMQDMGNEMRQKYGGHILAKVGVEYLPRDKEMIVIDGIRNPEEIMWLKKEFGGKFVLIGIDAPAERRFEFATKRGEQRDPKSENEFKSMDSRDQGQGEPEFGQQVKKCLEMADYQIVNEGSVQQLEAKIAEIAKLIMS